MVGCTPPKPKQSTTTTKANPAHSTDLALLSTPFVSLPHPSTCTPETCPCWRVRSYSFVLRWLPLTGLFHV